MALIFTFIFYCLQLQTQHVIVFIQINTNIFFLDRNPVFEEEHVSVITAILPLASESIDEGLQVIQKLDN